MTEPLTVTLIPLCRVTYELAEPIVVSSGPEGTRIIGEITGARYEGDRLQASLKGRAAADWAFVEPSGRIRADVRLTLETDDGATILVTYKGRGASSTGTVYSTMFFETSDERYTWLTRFPAVAKGSYDGVSLEYLVYQVD